MACLSRSSSRTPLDIDLELPFGEPLTVTAGEVDPTVVSARFDLGQWFNDQTGAQLDPNDPADQSELEGAITRPIDVVGESSVRQDLPGSGLQRAPELHHSGASCVEIGPFCAVASEAQPLHS